MQTQENHYIASPPRLHNSFSANDVPTINNTTNSSANNANNHAQQHFHNHNASMGRIPAGAVPSRHSRELSNDNSMNAARDSTAPYPSIHSTLQASAPPFGPSLASAATSAATAAPATTGATLSSPDPASSANSFVGSYQGTGIYAPANGMSGNLSQYNLAMLTTGMRQMGLNGANGGNVFQQQSYTAPQQSYNHYNPMPYDGGNQQRDSQARVIQNRRQLDNESKSNPMAPCPDIEEE